MQYFPHVATVISGAKEMIDSSSSAGLSAGTTAVMETQSHLLPLLFGSLFHFFHATSAPQEFNQSHSESIHGTIVMCACSMTCQCKTLLCECLLADAVFYIVVEGTILYKGQGF